MNNDLKGCLQLLLWWLIGGVIMACVAIFIMARLATEQSIEELLATLSPVERNALADLCRAADFEPESLRPVGVATATVMRDPRNTRSVSIRDGHVRAIGLASVHFFSEPRWSAFAELEALWLEESSLKAWPDLSALSRLSEVQLSGNPLPSPPAGLLPDSVRRLGLARTRVEAIYGLTGLALDEIDLSETPIQSLPEAVPESGEWRLRLAGTAIVSPPGHRAALPAGMTNSGPILPGGVVQGMASHRSVEVDIRGDELSQPVLLGLPTNTTTYHTSGPVTAECRVSGGSMRVWLVEPEDAFDGPWFRQGKVEGFGLARPLGYAAGEIVAGKAGVVRGRLIVTGSPPRHQFAILLEPVPGARVTGVDVRIRTETEP